MLILKIAHRYFGLVFSVLLYAGLNGAAFADSAAGETIAKQGAAGNPACMVCHGRNGEGNLSMGTPRIAGVDAQQLGKQLQNFKDGSRANPLMTPIAQKLRPQEIADVSAYYSALPAPAVVPSTATVNELGKKLATSGNWDRGMPACFSCHGENGRGIPPHFPTLRGLSAAYIVKQIEDWQAGRRKNDPNNLMKSIATKLDANQLQSVAAYVGNLP